MLVAMVEEVVVNKVSVAMVAAEGAVIVEAREKVGVEVR